MCHGKNRHLRFPPDLNGQRGIRIRQESHGQALPSEPFSFFRQEVPKVFVFVEEGRKGTNKYEEEGKNTRTKERTKLRERGSQGREQDFHSGGKGVAVLPGPLTGIQGLSASESGVPHRQAKKLCRKVTSLKKFSAASAAVTPPKTSSEPFVPIVLSQPRLPAQEDRWQLRNMWELASVLNFLQVFRPVLKIGDDFTAEELESALLVPNNRLGNIHIILLKAVPPVHRSPLNLDTWVTILTKKLQSWWSWVAEGPCPLFPAHGQEIQTYKEFDPGTRLIILKALCEIRLDQDDTRSFLEHSLKQGTPIITFRKERIGADMYGTTYWYFEDPALGYRLCRDTRVDVKVKGRIRARDYPPPVVGQWETVATNYEEFCHVAEKLTSSSNRLEAALGKKITSEILPELEEIQKKKERTLKKQQRQAVLLDSLMQGNGLAAGRSRRDRKPVSYTFDDYDRSINEAIKFTKKRQPSPDASHQHHHDLRGSYDRSNGTNGHSVGAEIQSPSDVNGHHPPEDEGLTSLSSGRRQTRRSQRYSESEYVHTVFYELGTSSDEEIEGEAIYDESYLRAKKRRKKAASGDEGDDEEYKEEDEGEEANLDDDEIVDSDEDDGEDFYGSSSRSQRRLGKRKRKEHKVKSVDELQGGEVSWSRGLRRSKRATKSTIDYSKFGESEEEENVGEYEEANRAKTSGHDSDGSFGLSENSHGRRDSDADSEEFPEVKANRRNHIERSDDRRSGGSLQDPAEISDRGPSFYQHAPAHGRRDLNNRKSQHGEHNVNADVKPHRFLDLNVAAPAGGGFEDAGASQYNTHDEDDRPFQSNMYDDDDDSFGDGGRVDASGGYGSNGLTSGVPFGGTAKRT
ncbi:hypothetical protein R1flu_007466 [Riccia fluitans]|uniref:DDT domain-containing protein n=1 Tax=Riccia fluitans TaxID=41844 RepID=A0ABD1YYX8_9MARC